MFLYVCHAVEDVNGRIMIRSTNIDIVLAITLFEQPLTPAVGRHGDSKEVVQYFTVVVLV